MIIAKFQFCHGLVGNAPKLISLMATQPVLATRTFEGNGAPTSSTLKAGNGMYCATTSGFVLAASIVAQGSGYVAGDVLTEASGTGTATSHAQIIVDAVDGSGKIMDFHVSTVGNYPTYPTNAVAISGGTGSGATFNLALQPADYYLDTSAQNLYVCTTAGTNATSVWKQISGGGTQQFKVVSDGGDYWNCNTYDGTTTGSTMVKVAKPYKLRPINGLTSENIRGNAYTYSYTAVASGGVTIEYTRQVTLGGSAIETDYHTPVVLVGDIIVAESFTTNSPSTLTDAKWIYHGVFWAGPQP